MNKKVILITGGSSGIGKDTGIYLKSKGLIVYGTTRNLSKNPNFDHFPLVELDVKIQTSIDKAIATVLDKEGQIDVLINNAGVGITGPIEETPISEIERNFNTNFLGPIRMIQSVLPQMRKQGKGLIINITSIAGYMGLPFRGVYSASKGALELVTETLRMETKDFGVRLVNLAPGDFATNIASGRYHAPVVPSSPYEHYASSLELIDQHVDTAQDPLLVAKKIYGIILKTNPKGHYLVGSFMQKFSIFLKKILPNKVFEKLLLKHYKL